MNTPRIRRAVAAAATLGLMCLGATGCSSASGASDDAGVTIRYQNYTGQVDLPELADALGYFKGTGIKLKRLGEVQGGPESLRAAATGQTDYGAAFNGAIAKLASTGAPIKAVIAYYGASGDVSSSLLTKKDSGIRSAKDLIGKKVAVNTLGANAEAIIDTYFDKAGLTPAQIDQVTLVPLPGINTEAALRNGQVDAGYLFGALKEVALEHGGLRELVNDQQLVGDYNGGSYVLRDDFIAKHPESTKKFVAALSKAVVWAQSHSVQQVRTALTPYYEKQGRGDQVKALKLWRGLGVATKGGVIRDQDFNLWIDWLTKHDEVDKGAIDVKDIYTNDFNPAAEAGGSEG